MVATRRLAMVLGLVALGTTAGACKNTDSPLGPEGQATTTRHVEESRRGGDKPNAGELYPNRPNRYREDQERTIGGEPARLAGFSAWVLSSGWQQSVDAYSKDGFLTIDVKVLNRKKDGTQRYDGRDWRVQTPRVQIVEPTQPVGGPGQLGSGSLVWGDSAEGAVYFDTPREVGDYYVIYKPKALDAARGIWKIRVD